MDSPSPPCGDNYGAASDSYQWRPRLMPSNHLNTVQLPLASPSGVGGAGPWGNSNDNNSNRRRLQLMERFPQIHNNNSSNNSGGGRFRGSPASSDASLSNVNEEESLQVSFVLLTRGFPGRRSALASARIKKKFKFFFFDIFYNFFSFCSSSQPAEASDDVQTEPLNLSTRSPSPSNVRQNVDDVRSEFES